MIEDYVGKFNYIIKINYQIPDLKCVKWNESVNGRLKKETSKVKNIVSLLRRNNHIDTIFSS